MAIERRLVDAVEITESQIHIIRLKGIFDASTVNEFEKVVSYLLARQFFKMVVDLGSVEFISSAGWGAFTGELRRVRENDGDIKLAGMSPDVFDVFLLLELDRFISSYDTEEEAIRAFRQPEPAPEPVPERMSMPSYQKTPPTTPAKEMSETNVLAVYAGRPPALSSGDQAEYRRSYPVESETVQVEAGLDQSGGNGFELEQDDINDDTLEIEASLSLAAKGPEMYELLLTSGRQAFEPVVRQRSLPPPARHPQFNDIYAFDDSASALNQHEQDRFGAETELPYHQHEPVTGGGEHEETQELSVFSGSDFDFSGHEPIIGENDETAGVSNSMTAAAADFPAPAAQTSFRHDTEAFSELSLDLESHLQRKEPQGVAWKAHDDFGDFGSELEKEFSVKQHKHQTPKFNQPIFPPEPESPQPPQAPAVVAENSENHGDDFSETSGVEAVFPQPPAYNSNGNSSGDLTEDYPPPFSTPAPDFSQPVFSSFDTTEEADDDLEIHDIHDPWILEEIDTFPEEYEMEGARVEEDERPIAAALISDDFDFNWQASVFTPENKFAPMGTPVATQPKQKTRAVLPETALFDETEVAASFESDWQASAEAPEDETAPQKMSSATPRKRKAKTEIAAPMAASFDDGKTESGSSSSFSDRFKAKGKRKSVSDPTAFKLSKIPMSGDVTEMIRGIVAAYPDYGANMICKFLEERVEPPVSISRSKVYRYLCEANLNTRQKRFEYAGQDFDWSGSETADVAEEA
ncbi:MAG: anti-sigma factor antagonist [candidate division KSB1 bacterium]|nr:anti-sigma factor antagonist [candidate division KSB1 bacterium]MDZ7368173.1 anti-sigma factor antagonist [candidate division KSB1 bacterium]MDZ7405936.1 anti-sigma factor antagonist [candidate division KSB1 bacterium]